MNTMFIPVMAILLGLLVNESNGYNGLRRMGQNNNDVDLERVTELYDAITDLITDQDESINCCETRMNNLGLLLDESFEYCSPGDSCMDKDTFLSDAKDHCNEYKDVEDFVEITDKSNSYGSYSLSLSVKLIHLQVDDCEMTKTYDEVITYSDEGLITKMVTSEHKETLNCPSYQQPSTTQKYVQEPQYGEQATDSYAPEPDLPPVAVDDTVATDRNTPVIIDVLHNDYDPNQPLGHRKDTLSIASFTASSKGTVVKIGSKLTYTPKHDECGTDTFTYWIDADNGLQDSAAVNIEISCPPEPVYGQEIEIKTTYIKESARGSYGQEQGLPPVAVNDHVTTDTNTPVMIDVLDNDYDQDQPELSGKQTLEISRFDQGSKGTVEQKGNKLRYKPNKDECGNDEFKYWVVDLDDGLEDLAHVHVKIACPSTYGQETGEQPTDNSYGEEPATDYNNAGSEARKLKNLKVDVAVEDPLYDGFTKVTDFEELEYITADIVNLKNKISKTAAEISLVEAYAKDISEYRTTYRCELQYVGYPPDPVVLDDGSIGQVGGALSLGWIEYDVIDVKDEKNEKIRGCVEGLGRALSMSKEDKVDDINYKNKYCVDMVYEAVCHSDSCSMFKNSYNDRNSYLHLAKQYENMFDEATLEIEDGILVLNYRKGQDPSCSGQFIQKVEIEYDEDRQCISKWIDYMDDIEMTDADCGNSMAKLFEKLETQCKFDKESGGYDATEPAAGNQYGSELAPEANDDRLSVQQNEVTLLYVLANDKDPNHPELSGRDTLDITAVTNGNKGEVHISPPSKRLRYVPNDGECGSDSFEYTVVNGAGLSDTATVHITISCDGYESEPTEPVLNLGYGDEKYEKIGEIMGKMGNIACKSKSDTFDDDDIKNKICLDVEYEAVCNNEDKCGALAGEAHGKMAFLDVNRQYQDMFDEAVITYEGDAFMVEYRKGSCAGYYDLRTVIEYDSDRQCISKWIDHYDDLVLSDEACEDSADKWMNKIVNQCNYDDDNDNQYGDDKKEKVREIMNKMGDISCKSKSDKFDDEDMKNKICLNIEYESICNNKDKCGLFAGKSTGREAFLELGRKYQDMFDESTITYEDDSFLVEYRKGKDPSCSGYYDARIVIEYDSDNQCISKWTEYYDDLILSDSECEDSANKWMNKIVNQCQYDDDNDDQDATVNKTKILNSFYRAAFDCRLKKNQGNTALLDTFMGYLSGSSKLCVMNNKNEEKCYDKHEIRTMMSDRYSDDNEAIDYHIDVTYNEGTTIKAKCTSRRQKSNGCIVIKEEYDTCVFNKDGSIEEFKVTRSKRETNCEEETYGPTTTKKYVEEPEYGQEAADANKATELYDVITDLITIQDEAVNSCENRMNNLANLLDESFNYCSSDHDSCKDKDTFLAGSWEKCNTYKEVEDFITVTDESNSYGSTTLTISVRIIHLTVDDCTMTKTGDGSITYNDAGLITEMGAVHAKQDVVCPSYQPTTTEKYVEEPQYGPVAVNDHVKTDINTPVMIHVLDNDYDQDQPELSGKQTLEISHFDQGSKGTVEQKGTKLRYKPNKDECGSDSFTYSVKDLDDGLAASADVYIEIVCPAEPVYGQQDEDEY